jgi:hypothetical protein
MKKILIALAAVTAIGAGASAAQAKVHLDLYLGGPGYYGYETPYYVDYGPKCFYKKVKVVKWIYGEKHIFWKTKKICPHYGY